MHNIYIYNIYTEHVGGFDLTKNKSGNFVGNSVNYITKHSHNVGWLMVSTPQYESVGMIIPNIWKKKNVPNHQPVGKYTKTSKNTQKHGGFQIMGGVPQKLDGW